MCIPVVVLVVFENDLMMLCFFENQVSFVGYGFDFHEVFDTNQSESAHILISLISCLQTVVSEMATQWSKFLVFVMIFADNAAGAVVGFPLVQMKKENNFSSAR